ncbi:hypothetical protein HDU97_009570 [Phlyctochytrium planicorne]|nr:hypothetical protein HDU97_009570 [Phlyctochytrium planicorne]
MNPKTLQNIFIAVTIGVPFLAIFSPLLSYLITLPVYFQVLILCNLGVWCWASNVHILGLTGIDVSYLLLGSGDPDLPPPQPQSDDYTSSDLLLGAQASSSGSNHPNITISLPSIRAKSSPTAPPVTSLSVKNLYLIACGQMILTLVSVFVFAVLAQSWGEEASETIPALTYVILLVLLVWPWEGLYKQERFLFLRTMQRIALGGLSSTVYFCDVILADILTSFSRVVGDLQIVFTDLVYDIPAHDETGFGKKLSERQRQRREVEGAVEEAVETAWVDVIAPILICLPFLFRLRQCIAEYLQSKDPSARTRHMLNAIKYISAIPVIVSSWLINYLRMRYYGLGLDPSNYDGDSNHLKLRNAEMKINFSIGVWIFFSVVNSLYSLYWDICMDWHLGTISRNIWRYLTQPTSESEKHTSPGVETSFSSASIISIPGSQQRRTKGDYSKISTDDPEVDAPTTRKHSSTPNSPTGSHLLLSGSTSSKAYPPNMSKTPSSLALMANERSAGGSKFFLRPHLHFRQAWLYYGAILLDTCLRLSWIVKVTLIYTLARSSLRGQTSSELLSGLMAVDFSIKCLEILRRYIWVFFRCEREWVVKKGHVREDPVREVRVSNWESVGMGLSLQSSGNFRGSLSGEGSSSGSMSRAASSINISKIV